QMSEVCERADNHADAVEHLRHATALAAKLLELKPDDTRYAQQFVTAYTIAARLDGELGHVDDAIGKLDLAARTAKRFHDAEPGRVLLSQLVGDVEHERALFAERLGRVDDAIAHYKRCEEFWRPMCDAEPDSPWTMTRKVTTFSDLVRVLCSTG